MKLLKSWTGRGFYLNLGIAALSCAVLTGCAQFNEVTSRIPVMTVRMDSRYIHGTEYQKAVMLYEKGLLLEARSRARKIGRDDPDYRDASRLISSINSVLITIAREHKELGETYDRAGIYEKAASEYRASLKYNPLNSKLIKRVAEFNDAIKEGRRPESFASTLTASQPKKKPVVKKEKAVQKVIEKPVEKVSRKSVKKTVKKKEKRVVQEPEIKADSHYNRGKNYLDAGEFARAEGEFDLALALVPDYLDAQELRDISFQEKKKAVDKHLRNGITYFQEEEMELAIKEWETVLRFDPDNEDAKDYKYRAEIILERLRNIRGQQAGELSKPF